MALDTNIKNLITRIGTEIKAHRTLINGNAADLTGLTTTTKTNLVAAINELQTEINNAVASSGAIIDDTTATTTTVYSSSKTTDLLTALKNELLGGAGTAYDTLQELHDLMAAMDSADQTAIDALTTAVGNRLRFDAAQTLDTTQRTQALSNLGVGAATELAQGLVELATTVEATTGTDTARAVTPAGLKAVGDTKAPLSHSHAGSDVAAATDIARGTVELATTAEATTGTDTTRAVTPAGLKAVADTKAAAAHTHAAGDLPAASATASGIVELATTAEATTGTDTVRAVTPAGLKAVGDTKAPLSHSHTGTEVAQGTETTRGTLQLASVAEATTGTDTAKAVTAAGLKAVADTKSPTSHTHTELAQATDLARGTVELATTAETTTGTDTVRAVTPAGVKAVADTKAPLSHTHAAGDLPAASTTASGIVELATSAEAITGADTVRAVTPAALLAVTGDSTTDYVALFNTAIA